MMNSFCLDPEGIPVSMRCVPRDEVRPGSRDNGMRKKPEAAANREFKQTASEYLLAALAAVILFLRYQFTVHNTERFGRGPWYSWKPKHTWAWLILPVQFVRMRWVPFVAVIVIAGTYWVCYLATCQWLG